MNGSSKRKLLSIALLTAGTMASSTGVYASDDEWEFALAPLFLWGVNLEGDSTINGQATDLDLDFSDILDNLDAVFTVHFEARKADWTIFSDYQHIDLKPDGSVQAGPITVNAGITFKEDLVELGAGWAFSDTGKTRWELIGGARYTDQSVKVDIDISTPLSPEGIEATMKGGDNWWHGFAGLRVIHALSHRWSFTARGDLGYGGSDNSAVNLAFQFDYRFRDWGSVFFGGRYLSMDYSSSAYGYDAYKSGPLAGLTIHW